MSHWHRTRRELLRDGGALTAALSIPGFLAACGGDDDSSGSSSSGGRPDDLSGEVVFADYGGISRAARSASYFIPFTTDTGVKVVNADADPARLALMAERGRSQWDCYEADGFEAIDWNSKGWLEKLPDWVTRADAVSPELKDYLTAGFSYSYAAGFRADLVKGEGPQDWADFWNVDKFPGKRVWPKLYLSTAEPALLADGVAPDALYPVDFEQVFAKLDELRPNILFYESYAEAVQYLVNGDAPMAYLPNARITGAAAASGTPIEVVWNQAIHYPYEGLVVPKGAPNPDNIFALLDSMCQPERQAQFSKVTDYGPVMEAAYDFLDDADRERLPNSPQHVKVAALVDSVAVAKQNADYSEAYAEWLARG